MRRVLTHAVRDTTSAPPPDTKSSVKPRRVKSLRVASVRIALARERGPVYAEPIQSAADVHRLLGSAARSWDREHFVSLVLDGKGRVLAIDEVAIGTVTAALVHPREVLKAAVLANGVSLIVAHNHPSGDPAPSAEDLALTRRLKAASDLMGIALLDHVVLGHDRYYSFAEEGQL